MPRTLEVKRHHIFGHNLVEMATVGPVYRRPTTTVHTLKWMESSVQA